MLRSMTGFGKATKEFENKTALLMVKVEENLNELEDLRKKIIGTWVDKIGTIEFTDDNNFTFKQKNNYVTKGLWFLKDLENIVIRINSREEFFNIRNLEENFFSYRHNDSIFKLNRL